MGPRRPQRDRYWNFQQKWSSPLAALKAADVRFRGVSSAKQGRSGAWATACYSHRKVVCRTCTNASSNHTTVKDFSADFRRVFDTIAAHLPEPFALS
jgi:hypothetical protein